MQVVNGCLHASTPKAGKRVRRNPCRPNKSICRNG
nr:MAG TPA: hypothetical protein [Caudoviricetes sp.]